MPDTAAKERGIIRALKRRLKVHPKSRKLRKSLARHRLALARLRPPLRVRALNQLREWHNVREVGGNNRGPDVEKIIKIAGGVPGESWCGDAVAAAYIKAGARGVTRAWAYVPTLEKILAFVHHPRPGHVVIYNFDGGVPDHTGLFDRWIGNGYFWAWEGNTGLDGARSDSEAGGDGVHLRKRHISQVSSFRRVLR